MASKTALLAFLVLSVSAVFAEKTKYNGYKVYRVTPQTVEQVKQLQELESLGVSFWTGPSPPGRSSDIMFPPHLQGELVGALKNSGLDVKEYISDVQSLIDAEGVAVQGRAKGTRLSHSEYHRTEAINSWLDEQAELHSEIAATFSIGKSFEGRDLKAIKISKSNETKPAIWLDANIHAREWITGAVCLYVIDQLLNNNDTVIQSWTEDYDWYILPIHNPDGYEFSHNDTRLWRKTRSDTSSSLGCKGADPNRNWDWQWFTGGSSSNPCVDTFAGAKAFSEPETLAVAEFLKTIADRLEFFLTLHSHGQLILIPYGVEIEFPQHQPYMDIGTKTAEAIAQRFGTQFTPGNLVDLLYVASGGSMDWAHAVLGVDLAFTFELRDTGNYGFILPPELILPSGQEFMDGLAVMVDALRAGIPGGKSSRK